MGGWSLQSSGLVAASEDCHVENRWPLIPNA
jgi:hypothetical protein